MKRSRMLSCLAGAGLATLGLSACSTDGSGDGVAARDGSGAVTELRDSSGRSVGTATVTQSGDALRVRIVGTAVPQGVHGAHIHTTGACDAPDFTSAGPHWNPTGRLHGTQNPQGPHLGDMPNLLVGTDGRGTLEFVIPAGRLEGGDRALLDEDGASVVVHAAADDYRTDPSGNSGARIACGVLEPVVVR
jgi:Cu-Zn family superoxide dismutase